MLPIHHIIWYEKVSMVPFQFPLIFQVGYKYLEELICMYLHLKQQSFNTSNVINCEHTKGMEPTRHCFGPSQGVAKCVLAQQ